jgi:hypothetical protein
VATSIMASSDDEYEYDDSEDEEDFKDDDDDVDNMDWKPQLGNGDNPNAPPVAGTFPALECVHDFVHASLLYERCSLTPFSPPRSSVYIHSSGSNNPFGKQLVSNAIDIF